VGRGLACETTAGKKRHKPVKLENVEEYAS